MRHEIIRPLIVMYSVTREIHFSYGHRLYKHPGKCASLHGHNGRVAIEVASTALDDQGMVVDFEKIKQTAGAWIKETLDHKMILWDHDPLVPILERASEMPVLMTEHPTAEALARWIYSEVRKQGLPVTRVTFWETEDSFASYYE